MKLEFLEPEDLDRKAIDYLWDQGVNMDDWDYMFITNDLNEFDLVEDDGIEKYQPVSYNLERLLVGCHYNKWYEIKWKGKKAMVGVAYHG